MMKPKEDLECRLPRGIMSPEPKCPNAASDARRDTVYYEKDIRDESRVAEDVRVRDDEWCGRTIGATPNLVRPR
jgi:hypothetical protein